MNLIENDPRDIAYVALFLALVWYKDLTPEQALRLVNGNSNLKPANKLTPEIVDKIYKIMKSPNFKNYGNIESKFRVNRYDVYEALQKRQGKVVNH